MSDQPDYSRRDLLRHIGTTLSLAAGGSLLCAQDAQHVHHAVAEDRAAQKGKYEPTALTAHEYATLQRLSDLIIPADEHSQGALAACAADWIDFLCASSDEMKAIYTGGIGWLDEQTRHRYAGADFVNTTPEQQTAMLDLIAYRKNGEDTPELGPGIEFFARARAMVVDAYYTSPIGIKEVGYMGNSAMAHFSVPPEVLEYAIKRSPFA
jgi:hypothetical protein